MKLIIDRRYWLRGEGEQVSYLLRESDGKMCCLGFLGIECGLQKEGILAFYRPRDCRNSKCSPQDCPNPAWPGTILDNTKRDSAICTLLMEINDEQSYTEEKREELLKKYFKEIDIDAEFIN